MKVNGMISLAEFFDSELLHFIDGDLLTNRIHYLIEFNGVPVIFSKIFSQNKDDKHWCLVEIFSENSDE